MIMLNAEVLSAQHTITVKVTDQSGSHIPAALVVINDLNLAAVTDNSGTVTFNKNYTGSVIIQVSFLGYETFSEKFLIGENPATIIKVQLKEKPIELSSVTVTGSKAAQIKDTPYTPEVMSLDVIRSTPQPMSTIINQMPGIRIRQEGGMGSQSNIMLNGIDGKGVRVFVDDIPVYLMGEAYSINNISPNMIDRIEVYKGLVPVRFGSDALGGVINLVSRENYSDYLDFSYSFGSWNTHQIGLNTKRNLGIDGKYYVMLDAFYSHSDNDYWMTDREVPIDELGNTELRNVRRFHDKYSSKMFRTQFGVRNLSWANDLRLILSGSQIDKEWQHGFSAENPWGQTFSEQKALNTAISWKKASKVVDRWDASIMTGYNSQELAFTDTASRTYYWDGSYLSKTTKGESGLYADGRTPILLNQNLFFRGSFSYSLSAKHRYNLNVLTSYERLTGEDKAGASTYKEDPFKTPQKLFKNYAGLSFESNVFNEQVTNILSAKYFYSHSYAVNLKVDKTFDGFIDTFAGDFGFGNVLNWHLSHQLDYTLGYEYTIRQPDSQEIFGDYITIGPNPNLVPERSHNINTGIHFDAANERVSYGLNAFYRNTSNRIFLSTLTFGLSSYLNLLASEAIGLEGNARYSPIKNLNIAANATYQELTLREGDDYGKVPSRYVGSRIPNTPYIFGNAQIDYTASTPLFLKGSLQLAYTYNYINEFFRTWEVDGKADSKETIPTQHIQNIMITYTTLNNRWSLGFECRNLLDTEAYDNFSIQKPGRSFYLKIRMLLTK